VTLTAHNTIKNQKSKFENAMKPSLTALTHLAFHVNAAIDACPDFDLSYAEIHDAAEIGRLVEHLDKRLKGHADLYLLTCIPEKLTSLEIALREGAEALRGRESKKAHVSKSGLCLVMAIILEAIQQQYATYPASQPEPEPEPALANGQPFQEARGAGSAWAGTPRGAANTF
jgi:hypothetical protein